MVGRTAQPAANLQTVDSGQHDIQYDQVILPLHRTRQTGVAIRRQFHLVGQVLQVHLHQAGDVVIIFNDKDTVGHKQTDSRWLHYNSAELSQKYHKSVTGPSGKNGRVKFIRPCRL
jgi:hypothetical protein